MVADARMKFSADATGALAVISRLRKEMDGLSSLAAKGMSFGIGAATISAGVAALVAMTKAAIDNGDALNKMSQKTGLAVEDLSKLQYAADLSGVSNEALTKGLTAMAVGMAEAATGAGPLAEEYKKLGINVRNADGSMKSSGTVLAELADKFQAMPDGVEKTNLAVTIFGKKLGAEMIPLLNGGAAGLKAIGDEAEALGLVMSGELAKKSEEFNDNLSRMSKMIGAIGMDIAATLIPALNDYMAQLIDARKAGLGFVEAMVNLGLSNPFKSSSDQIAEIGIQIEKLKAGTAGLSGKLAAEFGSTKAIEDQIAGLEKLRKYYELQHDRETGGGAASAEKLAADRLAIERQLQTKLAELTKLRAVAEGKVNAEILDSDAKRTDAQIANVTKLRDSLTAAWNESVKGAAAAGEAAKNLLAQASDVRQSGSDKAAAKLRSQLNPAEQQTQIRSEFEGAASAAETAAAQAKYANMFGRTENAAKLAAQAAKDAERAAKFADQIDDPQGGANAIQRAAEIQAQVLEAQAKIKQQEQKDLEKLAGDQATSISKLYEQLAALQAKAASIKVEADISAASGALVELQNKLDKLSQGVTVPVTINQVGSSDAPITDTRPLVGTTGGYARGGWTGFGGKWEPAGIVHRREFVNRSEVTGQPGAIPFLTRFNQVGMPAIIEYARLKGYAGGGLVGNINMPSLNSRSSGSARGSNATFVLPSGERFDASVEQPVMSMLTTICQRQALKRGSRK